MNKPKSSRKLLWRLVVSALLVAALSGCLSGRAAPAAMETPAKPPELPSVTVSLTSTTTITATSTITQSLTMTQMPTISLTPTQSLTSTVTLKPTRMLTRTPAPNPKTAEACIAYFEATKGNLKYACLINDEWKSQVVDISKDSGLYPSLVFDPVGNAHISYYDQAGGDLKYATWDGTAWMIEKVDEEGDTGLVSSINLTADGEAVISYLDLTTWSIKLARQSRSGWKIETVEKLEPLQTPRKDIVISFNTSLKLDRNGNLWVAYIAPLPKALRAAYFDGQKWNIQTIGQPGAVNWFCSLDLDQQDEPAISFYDESSRSLKLVRREEGKWNVVEIEGNKVGKYSSLVFDADNQPRISYFDEELDDLRYAYWNGFSTFPMKMDSEDSVGVYTSLAVSPRERSYISYYDLSHKWLKVSYWTGNYWKLMVVDDTGDAGRQSSIAFRVIY